MSSSSSPAVGGQFIISSSIIVISISIVSIVIIIVIIVISISIVSIVIIIIIIVVTVVIVTGIVAAAAASLTSARLRSGMSCSTVESAASASETFALRPVQHWQSQTGQQKVTRNIQRPIRTKIMGSYTQAKTSIVGMTMSAANVEPMMMPTMLMVIAGPASSPSSGGGSGAG